MAKAEHKNVLLVVADDLGLMLGYYGLDAIQTPHVDKLAGEGTRFTNGFAGTASCSGSRSTIYTGLHTHQNGQYGLQQGWCPFQTHDHMTAPALFNALGYQTGVIGKVPVGPRNVYLWEWYAPNLSRDVRKTAAEAGRFFDKAAETGRPFHLTVGLRDPHRDETRGGFGNDEDDVRNIPVPAYQPENVVMPPLISDVPGLRAELVEYYKSISRMDLGIGLLLKELAARGLEETTLVVFVSDNGSPFLNSKTTLYDAGVRLPLVVRRPGGGARNGGRSNSNMVSRVDILPTCLDWAGEPDHGDDSARPAVLTANTGKSPKRCDTSFSHILDADGVLPADKWQPHVFGSHTFHEVQNYWPTRFARDHRYKYHRNIAWRLDFPFATDLYVSLSWEGLRNSASTAAAAEEDANRSNAATTDTPEPEELFDLDADPEEVTNLAGRPEYQDKLRQMRALLEDWQYQTDDAWLFRDGVSAITTQRAQADGLRLPDRFDFDSRRPGNAVGPHWASHNAKAPSASTTEFA